MKFKLGDRVKHGETIHTIVAIDYVCSHYDEQYALDNCNHSNHSRGDFLHSWAAFIKKGHIKVAKCEFNNVMWEAEINLEYSRIKNTKIARKLNPEYKEIRDGWIYF